VDGIDVTQEIVTYEGKKIALGDSSKNGLPATDFVTFRFSACEALRNCPPETPAEDKYKIDVLMNKLHSNDYVNLTSEEKSLIKKAVGERFGPELMAPVWRIIDPGAYVDNEGE